jgi:tRNA pseudouridine38-40 synthase
MPRYKITLEYDGTAYAGWQIQANAPSVQEHVSRALSRLCGEEVCVHGAGRTDAGVHARGQVAHFDLARDWPAERLPDALNHHLRPEPIAVLDCAQVGEDFDARFCATARHYDYLIQVRRAPLVLERDRVWRVPRALDIAAMARAARTLEGHHDFTTFRSVHCQARSPHKTLDRLSVDTRGGLIIIAASARSFMHNQVRSMVGSLKLVGEGKWSVEDMRAALHARDRAACGPVAPACGLYLMAVNYPADAGSGRQDGA